MTVADNRSAVREKLVATWPAMPGTPITGMLPTYLMIMRSLRCVAVPVQSRDE